MAQLDSVVKIAQDTHIGRDSVRVSKEKQEKEVFQRVYPPVHLVMGVVVNMTQLVYSLTLELLSHPVIGHADRIPPTHDGFDHFD